MNDNVTTALAELSGRTLVLRLDYRALSHPFSGLEMDAVHSDLVRNGLQRVLMTARSRSSTALAVSPSTYFLFDDVGGEVASQKKFIRMGRELSKNLVSAEECGLVHGIPFWGSLSALEAQAQDLRDIARRHGTDPLAFAKGLAQDNRQPRFQAVFSQSPHTEPCNGDLNESSLLQRARMSTASSGAYPGSVRLHLDDSPRADQLTMLGNGADTPSVNAVPTGFADDWGSWAEVVPRLPTEAAAADPLRSAGITEPPTWMEISPSLEPLISDIWNALNSLSNREYEHATAIHWALVELSDSIRAQDRSRLEGSLRLMMAAISAVVLNLAASAIWERYSVQIQAFLDWVWPGK